MKVVKTVIAGGCLLLTAGSLLAQNYYLATQQARRDSSQNDAEQQRIQKEAGGSPGAPGAPAPATAAPVDPALQATLNNVSSLKSDFAAAITSTGDKPDPAQKISLLNNLSQAAQGAKASADSVKKLATDLLTALAGKNKLAAAQQTKLAREIHALFNGAHLTPAQQQTLLADVQKILTDGDASLDDAVNVVTDLKAVVAETK
jgi:hypothetical protein